MSNAFGVDPDPARARRFFGVATRLLRDARRDDLARESAFFLADQACVSAMEAVLAHVGRAVSPGESSRVVLIREANGALGAGYDDLFDSLNLGRQDRNTASYVDPVITDYSAQAMLEDARALVEAVGVFMRR